VFVLTDRMENLGTDLELKGQAKLLGECVFELDSIIASLTDTVGLGVKKALKFTRAQAGKSVTVGRFVATFKVVGDYNTEEDHVADPDAKANEPKAMVDIDRALPASDFGMAKWRVRTDIRCGVGGPLNAVTKDGFPSLFVQIGWTQYKNEEPSTLSIIQSGVVEDNRHPIWNEQLLYNNPPESDKPCMWRRRRCRWVFMAVS
jgi:hypothetical protein